MIGTEEKSETKTKNDKNRNAGKSRFKGRRSSPKPKKSFFQQALNLGMSLYSNKDNFLGKAQDVIAQAYGTEKGLNLEEIMQKINALGRLSKAVFQGEYKGVSPLFLIKIGFAVAYYRYGDDFLPDNDTFIGVTDDLVVAAWALKSLMDEIEKFEDWENQDSSDENDNGNEAHLSTEGTKSDIN